MKIRLIICLGVAILMPNLAGAELPFPNALLGHVEGLLDICIKANPQAAEAYLEGKKQLAKSGTEKEQAEARTSKEYLDGLDAVRAKFGKTPFSDETVTTCKALVDAQ
jgi:hypothetical protein